MATRLGKIEFYVLNPATGLPVSGASVEVRRQGATIVSGGPTAFTVDNPGAVRHSSEVGAPAADSVTAYKADGTVRDASIRAVSAIGATSITVGGPGFAGTADDDRLSPTTNLPVLYQDDEGNETKTNPLSTDANGLAYAYAAIAPYDALVSGGTPALTPFLISNHHAKGGDSYVANAWGSGAQTIYNFDTLRALAAGDKHIRGGVRGVELWSISDAGRLTLAGGITSAGTLVMSGALSGVTSLTMNGALSGATTVAMAGALSGVTTATLSNDLTARRLLPNVGTDLVAADFVASAGWGNTPNGVITVQAGSCDTVGSISIFTGTVGLGANPTITLTFKNGAFAGTFPIVVGVRGSAIVSAPTTATWATNADATTATFMFVGTPVASSTYVLNYHTMGT